METPAILAQFPIATRVSCAAQRDRETVRPELQASRHGIPRARGAQVDLFESMDIENGLIVHHRVCWGWQGLKTLMAVRQKHGT